MSESDSAREEIERLHDRAARVRVLAKGVPTDATHVRLLNYAADLERDAQNLEAEIARVEAASQWERARYRRFEPPVEEPGEVEARVPRVVASRPWACPCSSSLNQGAHHFRLWHASEVATAYDQNRFW
jgi:hypothetical protein